MWGAFHDSAAGLEIGVFRAGRVERYRPRRLVVAAGAYERPFPAPGWTLPGVMGSGAAQTLARAYRVAPGRRVLIAGHGPLNFQVACELARGGVEVAGVAETAARPGLRHAAAIWTMVRSAPDLAADGLRYLAALARRRIPVFYRHALLRAEGAGAVERATLVRIDGAGRPVAGTERGFDVDTLCLGYGFLPSTEITRLLGCRHRADCGRPGALVVERDADGQTSIPGVYAAGDCGGIGGARLALAQGTLAGLAAARGTGGARLPVRAHPIQLVVTEPAPPLTRGLLACAGRHLTMKQFRNGNLVLGAAGRRRRIPRPGARGCFARAWKGIRGSRSGSFRPLRRSTSFAPGRP